MIRIILYSFILAAFSTGLHHHKIYREMIKDVDNLLLKLQDGVPQLSVPPVNDSYDLSCYVAELERFSKIKDIHFTVRSIIKKLFKKARQMNISRDNCVSYTNTNVNNEKFLKQMRTILQYKFRKSQ